MVKHGLSLQVASVHSLAQLLLSACLPGSIVGENWVNHFIQCHKELRPKYTWKYDYQCAKCENPHLIKNWFILVRETIEKYGILEGDIYNMDETVSCFVPLKHLYGQGMQEKMQYGIHSIGKGLSSNLSSSPSTSSIYIRHQKWHCRNWIDPFGPR